MNILTSKTEISDGRRSACFKVPQRTDYSASYIVHALRHCLHHQNKTETKKKIIEWSKHTAHDPCVRPPARSSYDILLRTTFSVVVDRSISLLPMLGQFFSLRRHVLFHGQSTTFICHVRVCFCLVSYVSSFCGVTHKASAFAFMRDSLHAIIYHNFYSVVQLWTSWCLGRLYHFIFNLLRFING